MHFEVLFGTKRSLRKIEEKERLGWELVSIEPIPFFLFGSGGWIGRTVIMRRAIEVPNSSAQP
jgi:hypothetical protein